MLLRTLFLSALLLAVPATASAAKVETPETFQIKSGMIAIFDITSNTGYLVNEDATYLPFLIASGQKRVVRYIGKTYFAKTLTEDWVAMDLNIQPKGKDFGVTGRFFRLYVDGKQRTSYGIHSYINVNKWLQESDRYKSFGCIIVSEEILDIIERAFTVNNRRLKVITTEGPTRLFHELGAREQRLALQNLN